MPNKATRVRYSGIAPFIDDTQANRVTAMGSASRLTTEDVKELGTLNIVEVVDDVPVVDISIDANESGTNELIALFANKGYGCNVVAIPSGSAIGTAKVKILPGSYLTSTGHRIFFEGTTLTVAPSANQVVYLLPEVSGGAVAKSGVTGNSSVPVGAITLATVVGSATIRQADITDSRPTTLSQVKELDYELAYVDIFVPVKQSGDGDVIKRTMYMEKAYVNSIDFTFQTSGVATASFRLETDNKRWFLNNNSQVIVDQYKSAGGATLTLTQTPAVLANGKFILCLYKNGTKLAEGTDFNVAGVTVTFVVPLTSGDLVKVRYTSINGGNFFVPVPVAENPHPELAGGIKHGQVELYLSDNTSQRTTRVTSARINMPLNREQLLELGTLRPYDRPLTLPINSTVSVELRDSDLEMMARFAGYTNLSSVNEIAIDDLIKNMGLTVAIYRENDVKRAKLAPGHPDKLPIKVYKVKNLIPQGENWDVRVDSDATQTFEFMAHNLTVSDSIDPTGAILIP
jgi:hypothetical protein